MSVPDSLASDIVIKTPEHEHLQAQLQLLLHQNDKSLQVEEIAELLHQQAMMSQRAELEAMAYEQVAATQRTCAG